MGSESSMRFIFPPFRWFFLLRLGYASITILIYRALFAIQRYLVYTLFVLISSAISTVIYVSPVNDEMLEISLKHNDKTTLVTTSRRCGTQKMHPDDKSPISWFKPFIASGLITELTFFRLVAFDSLFLPRTLHFYLLHYSDYTNILSATKDNRDSELLAASGSYVETAHLKIKLGKFLFSREISHRVTANKRKRKMVEKTRKKKKLFYTGHGRVAWQLTALCGAV